MSISSVNPYMSMMAAYKAATADNKQSNTPLDTVENTQANPTTRPGEDTVSISQEATQKSREDKYPLRNDPVALYNEWLDTESRYIKLFEPKPFEDLLPETQVYIEELREREKNAVTTEEKIHILEMIGTAQSYGDKEIINNDSDAIFRAQVEGAAISLKLAHSRIYNEPIAVPDGVDLDVLNKQLSALDDKKLDRDSIIQSNEIIGIGRECQRQFKSDPSGVVFCNRILTP